MKAVLRFDLSKPEQQNEYKTTIKSQDYKLALWDIEQMLRAHYKYKQLSEEQEEVVSAIRSSFYEIINNYNIELG